MQSPRASEVLATASIPVPRDLAHTGQKRIDIHLKTANGRCRWFHSDGRPTVVDGATIDDAVRVARLVWTDFTLRDQPIAPPIQAH